MIKCIKIFCVNIEVYRSATLHKINRFRLVMQPRSQDLSSLLMRWTPNPKTKGKGPGNEFVGHA